MLHILNWIFVGASIASIMILLVTVGAMFVEAFCYTEKPSKEFLIAQKFSDQYETWLKERVTSLRSNPIPKVAKLPSLGELRYGKNFDSMKKGVRNDSYN